MQKKNALVILTFIGNAVLGISNRVIQIVYYCLTNHWGNFHSPEVKHISLTFCILPSALNVFMMSIYVIFHREEMHTPLFKLKIFLYYVISCEFLYPVGVHKSFTSKYSENADNPIVTMRLINAIHVMFVSIPQLLIVPINSSAQGDYRWVDILSIVLSALFVAWSAGYYFICITNDTTYSDYIMIKVYKDKNN